MTNTMRARPTTYNGIEMRSRLEARYAALLDRAGLEWVYEPRAYANADGQYLPDFRVDKLLDTGRLHVTFIEVRPTIEGMARALTPMQVIWDSEPEACLMVTAPGIAFDWFASGGGTRKWHACPTRPWS